jgi:hypothetical protein
MLGQGDEVLILGIPARGLAAFHRGVFTVLGEDGDCLDERFSLLSAQPAAELLAGEDADTYTPGSRITRGRAPG